ETTGCVARSTRLGHVSTSHPRACSLSHAGLAAHYALLVERDARPQTTTRVVCSACREGILTHCLAHATTYQTVCPSRTRPDATVAVDGTRELGKPDRGFVIRAQKTVQPAAVRGRCMSRARAPERGDVLMTHRVMPMIRPLRRKPLMQCRDQRRIL